MNSNKPLVIWLSLCAVMVAMMAVIGAVTRLTESGLSMVEWRPLLGWIPPLNQTEWERVYDLYKQSPEFTHKHNWMSLADFQHIFFWEWLHRLWGRLIGIVYAVPLLFFALRKMIPPSFGWKFTALLLLGGLQGVVGWWMVKSGLIDDPNVSHFRLATHLGLALLLFSLLWWLALDLVVADMPQPPRIEPARSLRWHGFAALGLLCITIIWGAFVAGLDAGMIYNTFPDMDGHPLPQEDFNISSIIAERGWIQFTHRWLAISTGLVILSLAVRTRSVFLGIMVMIQVGLGISTLLTQVRIELAALHQAGAIMLLALLVLCVHRIIGGQISGPVRQQPEQAAQQT